MLHCIFTCNYALNSPYVENISLRFNEIYDCELHAGMRLEILDKSNYDVYDCDCFIFFLFTHAIELFESL